MSDGELAGRVALVTGGSRGIGRACCELIAAAGADVAVNYQTNESAAAETAKLVEQLSGLGFGLVERGDQMLGGFPHGETFIGGRIPCLVKLTAF